MFLVFGFLFSLVFINKTNFEMNIYVGNLNWSLTSDDLYNLFSPYGEVTSAKIVTGIFNINRSKGFGCVDLCNDEAARQAISNLHDTGVSDRKIVVNESAPRKEGDSGYKKKSFGGGGGGYNRGGGGGYNRGGSGGGYNRNRGEGG